jgi:hypothetical protein
MSYMSSQTRTPAMMDAARSGAGGMGFKGPSNIQFMLTRMTAFSKNTIRLQPQTKTTYNPGDTITFRLPASALLDMASMTLKFDFVPSDDNYVATTHADAVVLAAPPRDVAGFFRRVDVSMGATSVGLTGLHDYGCLSTLLYNHTIPGDVARIDGNWAESQSDVGFQDYTFAGAAVNGNTSNATGNSINRPTYFSRWSLMASQTAGKDYSGKIFKTARHPQFLRNYLGLLGGTYFRLLDTNLLPEVTISFTLGPKHVISCSDINRVNWTIQGASLSMESLNFGDG